MKAEKVATLMKGQGSVRARGRKLDMTDTDSSCMDYVTHPRKPRPKPKTVASGSRMRSIGEVRVKTEKPAQSKREKADSDKDSVAADSVGSHGEQSDKSAPKSDSNTSENSKDVLSTASSLGYQASGEPSSSGEVCSLQDDVSVVSKNQQEPVSFTIPIDTATSNSDSTLCTAKQSQSALSNASVTRMKERAQLDLQQTGSDETKAADSGFQSTSTLSQYDHVNTKSSSYNALDSNSKSGASSNSAAMDSLSGSLKDQSEISDMDVT